MNIENESNCDSNIVELNEQTLSSGQAAYNDNNLLEKQLESDESKYVKERLIHNSRYSKLANRDLTHLVLTTEDRVRVKNMNNECSCSMNDNNLLEEQNDDHSHSNLGKSSLANVYDEHISEDKDEDNYTSNFDSPTTHRRIKRYYSITLLSGKALELIMDYYGRPTTMYLLTKSVFHKILHYKIDLHDSRK